MSEHPGKEALREVRESLHSILIREPGRPWTSAVSENLRLVAAYVAELEAQVEAHKKDQQDWRKGVALIAAALGEFEPADLCCVRLANKALEMRSKMERTAPKEDGE